MVERQRICEVYTESARCGSGFLVTGRIVLTAAHAVGPEGSPVRIRAAGAGPAVMTGQVAWSRRGPGMDAALLEITDARWSPPAGLPAVRWGRLVTSAGAVACEAAGFPDAQVAPAPGTGGVMRDFDHPHGTISPLSGAKSGFCQMSVDSAVPVTAGLWKGLSGAAVLCGPLLTGVICQVAGSYGGRKLNVVPASRLLGLPGFRDRLASGPSRLDLVAEPVELEPLASVTTPPQTPAALLRADAESVRFRGRDDLLGQLRHWCLSPGGYSMRLLTGPGGQGKTRLAGELGRRLAAENWAVLRLAAAAAGTDYSRLATLDIPVLIIVDYAEARGGQVAEVVRHLTQGTAPARLLLLARAAGEWQRDFAAAGPGLELAGPEVPAEIPVPPLPGSAADRAALFDDAATDLSARLGSLPGHADVDWARVRAALRVPDLPPDRYGTVLSVHMAALAALLKSGHRNGSADTVPEDVLLGHEERYWRRLAAERGLNLPDPARTCRHLVAAASLCTAADEDEAVETLARLPGLSGERDEFLRHAAARWLHDLYAERNLYAGSLQPDVLAEHLIGVVLADRPLLLDPLLAHGTSRQIQHGLTVLARAAASRPPVAETIRCLVTGWPASVAPAAVTVATETANPAPLTSALDDLLAAGTLDPGLLTALDDALPDLSEIHRGRAERIAASLVRHHRGRDRADRRAHPVRSALRPRRGTEHSADLALALATHAQRLVQLGRAPEGLAAYQESTDLLKRLAKTDPAVHRTTFGVAVNDMAKALAALGRHREALAASDQAIALLRQPAQTDPDLASHAAAVARTNRATSLMELGRMDEALAGLEDAMRELRTLAAGQPAAGWHLGFGARNLAAILAGLNRPAEAVSAAREAVRVFRELAGRWPDQFDADLALALINLSKTEAEAGALATGAVAADEAVEILRRLSDAYPKAFGAEFALALMNQGAMSRELMRPGNGLSQLREAVTLCRGLASETEALGAQLILALIDLAAAELDLGHDGEACTLAAEAVVTAERLAEENPVAFDLSLARALDAQVSALFGSGDLTAGLAASENAVSVWRRLRERRPKVHAESLARALAQRAEALNGLNRAEEAHTVALEAVTLFRRAAPGQPQPELGRALAILSAALSDLERHEDALAASTEAVRIYRAQAETNPGAFRQELAIALSYQSIDLAKAGQREQALDATRESAAIRRELAAARPGQFEAGLADELTDLVRQLTRLGHSAESRAAQEELVALYRRLAEADPLRFDVPAATALQALVREHLIPAGETAAAVAALEDATDLLRHAAAAEPAKYQEDLASALVSLSAVRGDLAEHDQALAAAEEAQTLLRDLGAPDRDLAEAAFIAAAALQGLHRNEEALAAAGEATRLLQACPAADDDADRQLLALVRRVAGLARSELGQAEEAIRASEEDAEIMRGLLGDDPDNWQTAQQFAIALINLGSHLAQAERYDEARARTEEALRTAGRVSGPAAEFMRLPRAMSQTNLCLYLCELAEWSRAVACGEEAVTLFGELPESPAIDQFLEMARSNLDRARRELEQAD